MGGRELPSSKGIGRISSEARIGVFYIGALSATGRRLGARLEGKPVLPGPCAISVLTFGFTSCLRPLAPRLVKT